MNIPVQTYRSPNGPVFLICADSPQAEARGRAEIVQAMAEFYGEALTVADLAFLRYQAKRFGVVAIYTRHGSNAHFLRSRRRPDVHLAHVISFHHTRARAIARLALFRTGAMPKPKREAFERIARAGLWSFSKHVSALP